MGLLSAIPLHLLADANTATNAASVMHSFVAPVIGTMCVLASLVCTFFLINGGYHYMTSTGNPENLEHAKKLIRNAIIGLAIVLGAGVLTAVLAHAYGSVNSSGTSSNIPLLSSVQPQPAGNGLADVLIKAITGMLQTIIQALAYPFLHALDYFTSSTPLMAANASVFKLWLAIVGMADVLFVLVVALLGFHVMSYATFGLDEIEFKHLLPQIGIVFLLLNTSIFAVDGVIAVSNAMIHALRSVFPATTVWDTLSTVTHQSGSLGVASLLIMIVFFIFAVILLVYYVGRLVTLYLGAILSPLVLLLWLVPGFRDFVEAAAKLYLATIFVLFIHVVILQLAASIFSGLIVGSPTHTADPIMAMVVGLATVIALLKTQGVLMQLSYASIGPRSARKLGGQFINSVAYVSNSKQLAAESSEATGGTRKHGSGRGGRGGHTVINVTRSDYQPKKARITASDLKTGETKQVKEEAEAS